MSEAGQATSLDEDGSFGHSDADRAGHLDPLIANGGDKFSWLPAWRLRALVAGKEVSPVELTEHFLKRIDAINPELRAFRTIDHAGARAQAQAAERMVLAGEPLGPLQGVPMAMKEHLPVKGLPWHNLSSDTPAMAERDSIEAERLRAAGAILMGVLVAQGSNRDPALESRNPYDLTRTSGGSSLGSAAAVAGGLLPASVCTDGRGSTRLPAAFCGLVGMRSTRGRVPTYHDGTVSPVMITDSGPLARDVRDAATILGVLAGPDGRDFACLQSRPPDYLAALDRDVAGIRLAWTEDFGYAGAYATQDTPAVLATVRAAAFSLANAGAVVETIDDAWEDPDFATWVVHVSGPVLNERIKQQLLASGRMTADAGVRAQASRQRIWNTFRKVFGTYEFVLSPTVGFTAPKVEDWLGFFRQPTFMAQYTTYTSAANLLGFPAISVPAGFVDGLPVGLQIMGPPDSEPRLLQLAQAYMRGRA